MPHGSRQAELQSVIAEGSYTTHDEGACAAGGLPESWGDLDQLFELRLEANSFTGSIPASWQRLNTTIMDLHSNKLSGSLPEEFIQGWVGTALLDISSNAYAGKECRH